MADSKISALPAVTIPRMADVVPLVSGGTTSKATLANFLAHGEQAWTPPSDTGFSWLNQNTSTLTVGNDSLLLYGPGTPNASSSQWSLRMKSLALAAPYTITMRVIPPPINKLYLGYGLALRQAGAGTGQNRLVIIWWSLAQFSGVDAGGMVRIEKWTSPTAVSASYVEYRAISPPKWFRIQDDNTNQKFYISADGIQWVLLHTVARLDYLLQGADQCGFGVYTHNAATPNIDVPLSVVSFLEA